MNRSMLLRRLYWIGWILWFFVALALLWRMPDTLSFVTWRSEGNTLFVTWPFLISWAILILVWPLLLSPIQFSNTVRLATKGFVKLLYELAMTIIFLLVLVILLVLLCVMMSPTVAVLAIWLILFLLHSLVFRWIRPVSDISALSVNILRSFTVWWWQKVRSMLNVFFVLLSTLGPNSLALNAMRGNPLFFITWAVLLGGWQLASYLVPPGILEHPLVPGWDYVFNNALYRMSGDWFLPGGFPLAGWTLPQWLGGFTLPGITFEVEGLAPFAATGGARTWPAVFLALGFHSFQTLSRLVIGLALGLAAGLATGLAIPYWPALRQTSWAPFNFLRMIPLLAAIPWLQFTLGANLRATTMFIGFGVWVMLVVATMNSVANVPDRYIECARTLGASRPYTYFRVIVPGSMPELRTALLLSAGLGWSLTIAAEFLGFPTGLGYMASVAVQETNTARLVIVAVVVAFYSLLTFYFLNRGFNKLVIWMPQRTGQTDISKVAGAAGAARVESQLQES